MADKVFKILSIDGGGIRGLYSAIILARFEKLYGKICDHFDLICGTSTGGIIALALSIGTSAEEIVKFYKGWGPKIFPYNSGFKRWSQNISWLLRSSKYSNNTLRTALIEVLGSKVMNDAKCCLCIPAVNLHTGAGIVFKTCHNSSYTRDGELKMVDVALATSAAPTYLPITEIEGVSNLLVDGGLFANNPSLVGAIEAITHFVGEGKKYESYRIMSISNLSFPPSWSLKSPKNASIRTWSRSIIPLIMNTQSKAIENILSIAKQNNLFYMDDYLRIPEPALSQAQMEVLDIDRTDNIALDNIINLATAQADYWSCKPEVKWFFNEKTEGWSFKEKGSDKIG